MKLTDRIEYSAASLTDLIHIVVTGDTSQNPAGSSYKLPLSKVLLLSSDKHWVSGSTGNYSLKTVNNSGLDATGDYSLAEGYNTTASGDNSHAEGFDSIASGDNSHAEGNGTRASGYASHAGGNNTVASGIQSFVHGTVSTASGTNTIVLGSNITGTTDNTVYVAPLVLAKLTATQISALTAENGMIVYDTTNNKFKGYENGSWVNLV